MVQHVDVASRGGARLLLERPRRVVRVVELGAEPPARVVDREIGCEVGLRRAVPAGRVAEDRPPCVVLRDRRRAQRAVEERGRRAVGGAEQRVGAAEEAVLQRAGWRRQRISARIAPKNCAELRAHLECRAEVEAAVTRRRRRELRPQPPLDEELGEVATPPVVLPQAAAAAAQPRVGAKPVPVRARRRGAVQRGEAGARRPSAVGPPAPRPPPAREAGRSRRAAARRSRAAAGRAA